MKELHWETDGNGQWNAVVDYAAFVLVATSGDWLAQAAIVARKTGATEAMLGSFDAAELARDGCNLALERCSFCGSRWRCQGGREPSAVLRDRRVVGESTVFSPECEALERARQAAEAAESRIKVREIDGGWLVDQVTFATEYSGEIRR